VKDKTSPKDGVAEEVISYYERGKEAGRLLESYGRLEFSRTWDILLRYLKPPPATILDVGGGSGIYACPLAVEGYGVHLLDPVPLHVRQAIQNSLSQPEHQLASAKVGDARDLDHADCTMDAVLLFGPLYHLTEVEDRLMALQEAERVLRSGGMLFAAGISRFASTLQGFARGYINDPEFAALAERDLEEGQHRNPSAKPGYFTTAYFHHPDDLVDEVRNSGFSLEALLAVEGPFWMLQDIEDQWADEAKRQRLLDILKRIEGERSLLGASAHIMAVGRKS
jgi:ubiquinone/menaquinone biosynthesis C-methylase UbiE